MKKVYMKAVADIKKRNPIAKALKFFTQKIIRDKTKYRRTDGKIWKREIREWDGD
jgi:ribosomal protein L14